eukprot:gene39882-48566_t
MGGLPREDRPTVPTGVMYAEDSDNSDAEEEGAEGGGVVDVNRQEDWQAYLSSFASDVPATPPSSSPPTRHPAATNPTPQLSMSLASSYDDDDEGVSLRVRENRRTSFVIQSTLSSSSSDSDDEDSPVPSSLPSHSVLPTPSSLGSQSKKIGDVPEEVNPLQAKATTSSVLPSLFPSVPSSSSPMSASLQPEADLAEGEKDSNAVVPPPPDAPLSPGPTMRASILLPSILQRLTSLTSSPNFNLTDFYFTCIANQDVGMLECMLATYPECTRAIHPQTGQTGLHAACLNNGLPDVVEVLLRFNVNINAPDKSGKVPLHSCHNPDIIARLCEEGGEVDKADSAGYTALYYNTLVEDIACIQVLLYFGANPCVCEPIQQRTCLHMAADKGSFELLHVLLTNSKHTMDINALDIDGNSPLVLAAQCAKDTAAHLKIFMFLLEFHASVHIFNEKGGTALHYICANQLIHGNGQAEPIVEMLLDQGADPNAQDSDGCTPLTVAVAYREWNICKLLLQASGDLNVPCSMASPLLQAKGSGETLASMKSLECTASDLLPKQARYALYKFICCVQTKIPGDLRDRCMNCANTFKSSSYFSFSS